MNTNDLENKRVWVRRNSKNNPDGVKKLGRIHALVFHPKKLKFVGFLVKRPDIAWMFRREDSFVGFNGFDILEDDKGKEVVVVKEEPWASGKGALKSLGVNLDECLLWIGLSVICEDQTSLGTVDSVEFDEETGDITEMTVGQGSTANALLGKRKVPASMIKGFKIGVGSKLNIPDSYEEVAQGAIVVSNEAANLPVEGGAAEKAGNASAIAIDKAKKTTSAVKEKVAPAMNTAGEAVQKGAFATGRQIARTEGMFKNFKDEFKKALNDGE